MNDTDIVLSNQGDSRKSRKPIILAIIIAILVIVGVIVIFRIMDDRDKVFLVDDSNELSEMPMGSRENIERRLCLSLKEQFRLSDCMGVTANVRHSSAEYNEDENELSSVKFLVDIDSFKQTYKIENWWAKEIEVPDDVSINCPIKEYLKYPEEGCFSNDTVYGPLDSYLPITLTLPSGIEATVGSSYYDDDGNAILMVNVNSCGDKSIINSARKAVDDWLVSNDFNPSDYVYDIPPQYDKCKIEGA